MNHAAVPPGGSGVFSCSGSSGARRFPNDRTGEIDETMHILILRDPRESMAKCSLTRLRGTHGLHFVDYLPERRLVAGERVLLHPDGEELSGADRGRDLFLVDCSWRRVDKLIATVDGSLLRRRLPPLETAYPRKSKTFDDPSGGLASVEALYAACLLMGEERAEFLAEYRWKEEFLRRNVDRLRPVR